MLVGRAGLVLGQFPRNGSNGSRSYTTFSPEVASPNAVAAESRDRGGRPVGSTNEKNVV